MLSSATPTQQLLMHATRVLVTDIEVRHATNEVSVTTAMAMAIRHRRWLPFDERQQIASLSS